MITLAIETHTREEFIDVTSRVQQEITNHAVKEGVAHLFVPHTTAGITINENADPHVVSDILQGLHAIVPEDGFLHAEGNSPAHIKASLLGPSLCVNISDGQLVLGTWQGIYFCEFDGPRSRQLTLSFYT